MNPACLQLLLTLPAPGSGGGGVERAGAEGVELVGAVSQRQAREMAAWVRARWHGPAGLQQVALLMAAEGGVARWRARPAPRDAHREWQRCMEGWSALPHVPVTLQQVRARADG